MGLFNFIKLDPPGTFCTFFALEDLLKPYGLKNKRFLEIGCGEGSYSKYLCSLGAKGVALDFSEQALEQAKLNLSRELNEDKIKLMKFDFMNGDLRFLGKFDVVFSIMVLEHLENEIEFLKRVRELLTDSGVAVIIVPSRMDAWGPEDELAGHLRRYSQKTLQDICNECDFRVEKIISIGVPIVNLLLRISNYLVSRAENEKQSLNLVDRTKLSGTRDIPFKTVFPSFFKLILNPVTLWPLKVIQRLFYKTEIGLVSGVSLVKESGE